MGLRDWFRRKPPSRFEPRLEFVGEQDGENERKLKALLLPVLARHEHITRAYLARAGFQPGDPTSVLLALIGPDKEGVGLLDGIQSAFHTLAPSDVFLDIAFLTDAQEADLARVCRPFYQRPPVT
jgi:SseB protein C-terminal domain